MTDFQGIKLRVVDGLKGWALVRWPGDLGMPKACCVRCRRVTGIGQAYVNGRLVDLFGCGACAVGRMYNRALEQL